MAKRKPYRSRDPGPAKPGWNGEAMRLFRIRARLSVPDLARRLKRRGYKRAERSCLYRYELGQRVPPRELVVVLADMLACTPDDLSNPVEILQKPRKPLTRPPLAE